MTTIYEIEEQVVERLRAAKRDAEEMRDVFRAETIWTEGDNWSAVVGLLDQALKRFGGGT